MFVLKCRLQLFNYQLLTFNDRNIPQTSLRALLPKYSQETRFDSKTDFRFRFLSLPPCTTFQWEFSNVFNNQISFSTS